MAGLCECNNETSGSIKCGELNDQRRKYVLKKDSSAYS